MVRFLFAKGLICKLSSLVLVINIWVAFSAYGQDSLHVQLCCTMFDVWCELEDSDYSDQFGVFVSFSSGSHITQYSPQTGLQSAWHDINAWDVEVAGNYMYTVPSTSGNDIIRIYRIDDLNTVELVGNLSFNRMADNDNRISIFDDILLYDVNNGYNEYLILFFLDPPNFPVYLSMIEQGNDINSVIVNDHIYTLQEDGLINIWDITDPSNPVNTGTADFSEYNPYRLTFKDGICAFSCYQGLFILDTSEPSTPEIIASLEGSLYNNTLDFALLDDYLFLARSGVGYTIVNIGDINNPELIESNSEPNYRIVHSTGERLLANTLDSYSRGESFGVFERIGEWMDQTDQHPLPDYVYSSTIEDTLLFLNIFEYRHKTKIYDISNIEEPHVLTEISYSSMREMPWHIDTDNGLGVVGDFGSHMRLFNYQDLNNVHEIMQLSYYYNVYLSPLIHENALYFIHDCADRFYTIDLSTPDHPVPGPSIDVETPDGWVLEDNRIWMVYPDYWLTIDVANPLEPCLDNVVLDVECGEIAVHGNRVMIAVDDVGYYYYDVTTIEEPELLGVYETPDERAFIWSLHENHAVIGDRDMSIGILDLRNPSDLQLYGYYDNSDPMFFPYPTANDSGDVVFAGTYMGNSLGLYHLELPTTSAPEFNTELLPGTVSLVAWPNPFNPSTTIQFGLTQPDLLHLSVYNILGEQVMDLTDGYYPAGLHQIPFDGSHLASGVYLFHMQSSQSEDTVLRLHLVK